MNKKEMPAKKRLRVPTQKMKDSDKIPQPNEESRCFAFVRWEDGYTGKILTSLDILARDEGSVKLQDLRSGDPVLAKWSDGKFYKATVEYISEEDQSQQSKGHHASKKSFLNLKENAPLNSPGPDIRINSPLLEDEEITALNSSPDGGHATGCRSADPKRNGSNRGGTAGPLSYGDHTPSPSTYGLNTCGPSPYGVLTLSPSTYGHNTSGPPPYGGYTSSPSLYGQNTFGPPPYGRHTPSPSVYGNTSGHCSYGDHIPSPPAHGHDFLGPSRYGGQEPSPSLMDLSRSGISPGGGNTTCSPADQVNPLDCESAASLPQVRTDAGNTSDQGNDLPGIQAQDAWTPCDGCKEEVERILNEKRRIEEVIARIDPDQVRELQTLCSIIGERHHGPSSSSGQQELFPGCGVFVSSFRLAAMSLASKPSCMRLFHALFEHFFTAEECQNAVPFGRPGNNPLGKEGKRILDRKKVDAILTYVLRCSTLPGWDQIEEAKLKKAFVNKCRARAGFKE